MDWRAEVARRLPQLTGDVRRDGDVREELAQHCLERCRELVAAGTPSREAEARVLGELQDAARRAADLARAADPAPVAGAPSTGIGRVIDAARQDVRLAARRLVKAPAFSIAAVLTLAVAIGATTAVFSVVDEIGRRTASGS